MKNTRIFKNTDAEISPAPLVSIIVPAYNSEQFIHQNLKSIQDQTYNNIQIIVVDDGSTDATPRIVDQFASEDERTCIIHQANRGVSAARNRGLEAANGQWITFVDADDIVAPNYVYQLLSSALKFNLQFVASSRLLEDHRRNSIVEAHSSDLNVTLVTNDDCMSRMLYAHIPIGCWNKLYQKNLLDLHGIQFDTELSMGEGLLFTLTVASTAERIGIVSDAIYWYRRDNSGSATSVLTVVSIQNSLKALQVIHERLGPFDDLVAEAFAYHFWRTSFLLKVAHLASAVHTIPDATTASQLRKGAWHSARNTMLLTAERLRCLIIAVSPGVAARLLLAHRSIRTTRFKWTLKTSSE